MSITFFALFAFHTVPGVSNAGGASFRAGVLPRSQPGASSLLALHPPLHLHARVPLLPALRGGGGKNRERRRSKSGGGGSPGRNAKNSPGSPPGSRGASEGRDVRERAGGDSASASAARGGKRGLDLEAILDGEDSESGEEGGEEGHDGSDASTDGRRGKGRGEDARGEKINYKEAYHRLKVEVAALSRELRAVTGGRDAGDDERGGREDGGASDTEDDVTEEESEEEEEGQGGVTVDNGGTLRQLARYIPLRLSTAERKLWRLLEAALTVSEYVDRVDIASFKSPTSRMVAMVREICALLCGLKVAEDYRAGQRLIEGKNYAENAAFFREAFEVGRRYKIMNPDGMRGTYGKLIYLLQDAANEKVRDVLGFEVIAPVKTVASTLSAAGADGLLDDPLALLATREIASEGRPRHAVDRDIKNKCSAVEALARKYACSALPADEIRTCVYSLADANAFLRASRDPADQMLKWLRESFSPERPEAGFSLAIDAGKGGARLTHSHTRQYRFVEQSLMLWREILTHMFRLWTLTDGDLLDTDHPYSLRDTGQGLNRVQSAGRVGRAMHKILGNVQEKLQSRWEGSSVIHLGDHNVPNAFFFLDKYTQVDRILAPMVRVIQRLPELEEDAGQRKFIREAYGGHEKLKKVILADFFRKAFDGSGADNFYDAGSCVDGRLTSAWNWCSKIHKKAFYSAFLLAGFSGFDGKF